MKLTYDFFKKLSEIYNIDSFYIVDLEKFKKNYYSFKNAFEKYYNNIEIAYSYKTNYIPEICKMVKGLGGYAEVVSEMEYDLAVNIGMDTRKIIVNGPYKPLDKLEKYLLNESIVNIDSVKELFDIIKIAKKYPKRVLRTGIRLNFEISGLKNSRFGIDVSKENLYLIINKINETENIKLEGIHSHFPNRDLDSFRDRINKMLEVSQVFLKWGRLKFIDLGGGFAGDMPESLKKQFGFSIPSYNDYAEIVGEKFHEAFEFSENKPTLILEPGTALVADTMVYVVKVLYIKNIRGKFIAQTSGSKLNFSSICSTLNLPIEIVSKGKKNQWYDEIDFTGYTCIESDYLYKKFQGNVSEGDFIIFKNVGSYSIVFKPPFILPNVPVFAIEKNKIKLVKRKEIFDDIFRSYIY